MKKVGICFYENVFLCIKKALCVFLMFAICFNVFFTKNQEFKNKFITALNCAVNTLESAVFNEYTNKMLKAVNNIMQSLSVVTGKTVVTKQSDKTDNKQPVPVNSSSEEVIITKRISDTNISLNFIKTKIIYFDSVIVKQLNNICSIIWINSKEISKKIGILFFILFSIFIVRIKDVINNEIIKNNNIIGNRLA